MANTKISDFTSGAPAQSGDEFVIARSGANFKLAGSDIKTLVVGAGDVSVASTKTLTASNTLTLAGTDGSTMTFPSTSATLARTDAANTFTGSQTVNGGTITADAPVLNMSQTWNDGAVTFTGLKFNVASDTSAAASLLMDLQVGGASAFNVSKAGSLKLGINSSGTNVAGTNVVVAGSQGTGNAAGGSIIFQVAPAGSSGGTAQNALATALTITSARQLVIGGTGSTITSIASTAGSNSGIGFNGAEPLITRNGQNHIIFSSGGVELFTANCGYSAPSTGFFALSDTVLRRDTSNTLAQRNGVNAQESRVYGSYTAADNFQRMSIKTLRESSGALSGATYVTTIAIPAYANLIGVTTRVTTAVTGATTYDVGDGSDVDLWGAAIAVALGSQSRTADFTAVAAVGAAATSRTVTLTANGSNFTGGVVEICLHYLTTEAD